MGRHIAPSDLTKPGVFAREWVETTGENYANYGQVAPPPSPSPFVHADAVVHEGLRARVRSCMNA